MKYLPSITKAKYVSGYIIGLTFDDGTQNTVDFSLWLDGEVFEPLKKKSFFKSFFLDCITVTWPDGVSIAPETLYKAAKNGRNRKLDSAPQRRRKSA